MRYFLYLCLCFGGIFLAATQVQAAQCADHATIVQRLGLIYGETRRSSGWGPDDTLVEVFAAPQTGSWTIAITGRDGWSCLVAAGQAFDWRQPWLVALRSEV